MKHVTTVGWRCLQVWTDGAGKNGVDRLLDRFTMFQSSSLRDRVGVREARVSSSPGQPHPVTDGLHLLHIHRCLGRRGHIDIAFHT